MNEKKNSPILGVLALMLLVIIISALNAPNPINAAVDDNTLGRPQTVNVQTVTAVTTVSSVTDVAHITAGHVQTDEMGTGMIGSETISVVTASAVKVGTLTTGTKQIEVVPSVAVNYGPAGIVTGTGYMTLAANSRTVWNVATTTPAIYFVGQTTTGTVNVVHVK